VAVDAEGAVRDWVNSLQDLVGQGRPLQLGAHLGRLRSPGRGAYAYLLRVGGTPGLTAERPLDQARISATIFAPTKEIACAGAVAYANALETLDGRPTPMGPAVVCQTVDNITGPVATDEHESNREQYRYLVDADFVLVLAAALTA
jgi:hypothetical protein